ncbi:helix-turn-helix domain-containing protein [[Haemophilus] ducreyi]|nr:helix-turn-helix transcriptional regulator [[Haemophilus] ducreyi]
MVNQIAHNPLSYSDIAEKLGHNNPTQVNAWFTGEALPSFNEMEQLSFLFGCNANWLKHGVGELYQRHFYNIAKQPPIFFARDFLNTMLDSSPVYKLHIVLNENTGYVYLIQEFEQTHFCYTYLSSSFYLKGEYGSSGLVNAARFILMLLALDRLSSKVIIKGYTIEDKFAKALFERGEKHPLLFRSYSKESTWNEDIIDKNYPMSYWEGYKTLQQQVHEYIDNDELLTKYKKEILCSYD